MEIQENASKNSSLDIFEDDEAEISFRGKEFSLLKRHPKLCTDWKTTKVFVQHQDWDKPFPKDLFDIWDNNHVRLPWSRFNEFPKDGQIVKR